MMQGPLLNVCQQAHGHFQPFVLAYWTDSTSKVYLNSVDCLGCHFCKLSQIHGEFRSMSADGLHDRGKALEDRFFQQQDQKLLEKLQQDLSHRESREALKAISGIDDQNVLDSLLDNDINANTFAAISLIPLIAVAWADKKMEEGEKKALMKAAQDSGISESSPSFMLLESWTYEKPDDDLFETWKEYIRELKGHLDDQSLANIKSTVVGRAKAVAESAGGFLGLSKVSFAETAIIKECERAFEK